MLLRRRSAQFAAHLSVLASYTAAAQTPINELRFGILAQHAGLFNEHVETGADVNFELPFTPPQALGAIGSLRPGIGGSLNTAAGTSSAYFGLTWGITLIQSHFRWGDSVLLNGSFGGALQGGYTDNAPPDRKKRGSTLFAREGVELG